MDAKTLIRKILRFSVQAVLVALLVLFLIYGIYRSWLRRHQIDYLNSLDEVAVTVDGDELTLGDLGFYVLYEEQKVEKEAEVYNPDNTKDLWNIHTNGYFLQGRIREAVMESAVHDRILYEMAVEEKTVLSTDEKQMVEDRRTDFWTDLYEEQQDRLPGTYESINRTIYRIAVVQKYQRKLAKKMDTSYGGLNWNGYDYQQLKENDHKVKINKKVWSRVLIGDITLDRHEAHYINGLSDEEIEKLQKKKK